MQDPLDFARSLIAQGVPVFVAPPDPAHPVGFRLPLGWQTTRVSTGALDDWQPGWAVCAVGGHGLDVIDVDPRNGGDVAAAKLRAEGRWPREYAIVATPSGGTHHYVAGMNVGKAKRDGIDLQAGAADGTGRGFIFLPGTVRTSKVDKVERGYVLARDELDLYAETIDDSSGDGFLAWIRGAAPAVTTADVYGEATALERFSQPVPDGDHDWEGMRLAASLAYHGFTEADAMAILRVRISRFVGGDPSRPFTDTDLQRWWRGARKFAGAPLELELDPATGEAMAAPSAFGRSWGRRDPSEIDLAPTSVPEFLRRSDGKGLAYGGEVNGLIGESESGKSWLAQYACSQALAAGTRVLYVDFESRYGLLVERLLALGTARASIDAHFAYVSPDEQLDEHGKAHMREAVEWCGSGLTVVDGYNAGMQLLGLDSNSTNDATAFHQSILLTLARQGACVIYVDHLSKHHGTTQTAGAIGSQAKRAMTSGSILRVKAVRKFGRGTAGMLALSVDKDRPGHVRALLTDGEEVALFRVEPSAVREGGLNCALDPAGNGKEFMESDAIASQDRRILQFIGTAPGTGTGPIATELAIRRATVVERLEALQAAGRITRTVVGNTTKNHLVGSRE